jgi:hypothetical protein
MTLHHIKGVRWGGHVARMAEIRNAYNILIAEDPGVGGKTILEW